MCSIDSHARKGFNSSPSSSSTSLTYQTSPVLQSSSPGVPIPSWDIDRSLRFATYGFALGPLIEKWNRFLEYRFPLKPISDSFIDPSLKKSDDEYLDPNTPAFAEKLMRAAEKEGFKVNIERGDSSQGQGQSSHDATPRIVELPDGKSHIVDPQTVAMPNTGQPGQISVAALFKRVAVDQLVMAPLGILLFLTSMGLLEGQEWEGIKERYSRMFWPILLVNWQMYVAPSLRSSFPFSLFQSFFFS